VDIVEETVDSPRYAPQPKQSKMGYYDEDGKHPPPTPPSPSPEPTHQVCSRQHQATTTPSVLVCTRWLTVLRTLKAKTALRSATSVRPAAPVLRRLRAPTPPTR